jgi:hypothetical protein
MSGGLQDPLAIDHSSARNWNAVWTQQCQPGDTLAFLPDGKVVKKAGRFWNWKTGI